MIRFERAAGVYAIHYPRPVEALPVVFDSPHSGSVYPADFRAAAALSQLRMTEDAHVHDLYRAAPLAGATLLEAQFPRCYIDPNRHPLDVDARLLAEPWPGPLQPSRKTEFGMGLVRRLVSAGVPVYDRLLSVSEVQRRLVRYYQPYHRALAGTLDRFWGLHGVVWHVNCHSMRSSLGQNPRPPAWKPDFIVSDRHGSTAAEDFRDLLVAFLVSRRHTVLVNRPFEGGEIVRRYGDPAAGRHSVQIEVNRKLYMDETTLRRHDGFAYLQELLTGLIVLVCDYARHALAQQEARERRTGVVSAGSFSAESSSAGGA